MYRQYENPYSLEEMLAQLKRQRAKTTDIDEIMYLDEEIADLKDRINFAWQDDEDDQYD